MYDLVVVADWKMVKIRHAIQAHCNEAWESMHAH